MKFKKHISPHGKTTALTMMKDEGPFVLEWVAHHLALGFTDIVAYTNDCTDGTDDMLMRMEELGILYHRNNEIPVNIKPQPSALKHAAKEPVVLDSDWIIPFDADEFLIIKHGDGTIDNLISSVKERGANGIVITWRTFGSNNLVDWSREPVTEQYTACAPERWFRGWGVKTLFKFEPENWVLGIHRPKMRNKVLDTEFPNSVKWLNGSGMPMEEYFKFRGWRSIERTYGYEWAQMNHYAVKSIDSYALRKFRGNVNNKADKYNHEYWSLQDRNEVEDLSALRHQEKREVFFDMLYADPVLKKLHDRAVTNAEARLEAYKATSEYENFKAELIEASRVPIHQVIAKPPKKRDKEAIANKMSEVEKRVPKKSKEERLELDDFKRFPSEPPSYTRGQSLSDIEGWEENHNIKVPININQYAPKGYEAVYAGKLERHHARKMPFRIEASEYQSFLDFTPGLGFIAAHIAKKFPVKKVYYAEEDLSLLTLTGIMLQENKLDKKVDVIHIENYLSLSVLLEKLSPDVVRINHDRLTAGILANMLLKVKNKPKMIILAGDALDDLSEEADQNRALFMKDVSYIFDPELSTEYAKYFKFTTRRRMHE